MIVPFRPASALMAPFRTSARHPARYVKLKGRLFARGLVDCDRLTTIPAMSNNRVDG